jgi:hypothetical protein
VPWLPAALRVLGGASGRERWALVGIGAGASAGATALFTRAFALGDAVTPLVLQKLRPMIASRRPARCSASGSGPGIGWSRCPPWQGRG